MSDNFVYELSARIKENNPITSLPASETSIPTGAGTSFLNSMNEAKTGFRQLGSDITQTTSAMTTLGIISADAGDKMMFVRSMVMLSWSAMTVYTAYRAMVQAWQARETAMAAIESAAAMATQNWPGLALATAAAVAVPLSFEAGRRFGSGEWNVNFDDSVLGRRKAIEQFRQVTMY